jgi:hypothetical protein
MCAERNAVITIRNFVAHPNDSNSRMRVLRAALKEAEAGASDGFVRRAQDGVKRALESLHELNDERRRGKWSSNGWSATDVETWTGLMGARNVSHHEGASIVRMDGEHRLTWSIDDPDLFRYPSQYECFMRRVANGEVTPMLQRIVELLAAIRF